MGLFEKARNGLKQLQSQQQAEAEYWGDFTPRMRQVFVLAKEEAKRMNHGFIEAEHLLLGLIGLGNGVAVNVLKNLGLNLESVRAEIARQVGVASETGAPESLLPSPRAMRVLDRAKKEAKLLGHAYTGTEHLLLELLAEEDGITWRIFKIANTDLEKTRKEILEEITPTFPRGDAGPKKQE